MRKSRNRTLPIAMLAVLLLAVGAFPTSARAADWSIFLSWYDSTDLQDALGLGVRASFPLANNWEFDVTASYYEDFEDAVAGPAKVEIGTIPVDFGFTWANSEEGGFYAGAGLTWAFMDTGGLEIANVDIPDPGEADDEFGAFGKLGYQWQGGFMIEFVYRYLDVSIESLQLGEVTIPEVTDRIDLDMDGFVINAGWRF